MGFLAKLIDSNITVLESSSSTAIMQNFLVTTYQFYTFGQNISQRRGT